MTPEGRRVVRGVFQMYNSVLGMSLSDIIDHLWDDGIVIDWWDFTTEAQKHGMSLKNVKRLVSGGFSDSLSCREAVSHTNDFFRALMDEEDD